MTKRRTKNSQNGKCLERRIFVSSIKVNGRKLSKELEIKEGVVNAFYGIMNEYEWVSFLLFGSGESRLLKNLFFEQEVFSGGLSSLSGDKAFGQDDFSIAFWKFCWDFVKE